MSDRLNITNIRISASKIVYIESASQIYIVSYRNRYAHVVLIHSVCIVGCIAAYIYCKKGRERTSKFKGRGLLRGRSGERISPLCSPSRKMRCRFDQNIGVLAPPICLNEFPRCLNWLARRIETRTVNRARINTMSTLVLYVNSKPRLMIDNSQGYGWSPLTDLG